MISLKIHKYFNVCNLYLGLWSLYYIQGIFYPMGSIIPRTCLVLVLMITLFYWVRSIFYSQLPQPLRVMNILVLVLFIYAILYQISGDFVVRDFDGVVYTGIGSIRSLVGSLLPVFPVYFFTINGYLNAKSIRVWTLIFFVVITCQFFAYEEVRLLSSIYDPDGITNNIAYYFVAMLPLVLLFFNRKILMYILLLYIMCFVIYGMKRGAILIGSITFLYIVYLDFKKSSLNQRLLILLLFLIIMFVMFHYINDLLASSDYFQNRLEQTLERESSGRDSYYALFWDSFINETSIIKILFGGGTYSTVRINGNLAHNDWFEILLNQGILGFVLFLVYWITWFLFIRRFKKSEYFSVLICFWIIFIIKTLFSMSITDTLIYGMLPVGYCLGRIHLNKSL